MLPSSINFMQRIWMLSSYSRKTLNFVGIFPEMHFLQLPSTVVVEFTPYGILTLPMWHMADVLYRQMVTLIQNKVAIILFELGLVIEFLLGSTILIPSSTISHKNVSIQDGESQVSFT